MLSQVLHTRQYTSICRLHIHRHFNTLTSTSEEGAPTPVKFEKKDDSQTRTAIIRASSPLYNIADTWTLLRAVERKYGKIIEARFFNDFEVKESYQTHSYVIFQDQESFGLIPKFGETLLHTPTPVVEDRPGGLGLDDIKHLLESTDRDEFESFEFPSAASLKIKRSRSSYVGVKVKRCPIDYYTSPDTPAQNYPDPLLAKEFIMWGGFHELVPMVHRRYKENEWLDMPGWEQMRMRFALQRCTFVTNIPNNAFTHRGRLLEYYGKVSDSSPGSESMDSPKSSSPTTTTLKAHKNDGKVSDSSPGSASMDSSESISPPTTLKAHKNDGKVSDSSSVSASMDSLQSSPPKTLDIPISREPTSSKSTQSRSLPTEFPQPPSQSPPEPTQLPPEPVTPPEPTIPPPGQQLSPEQLQEQRPKSKQLRAYRKRAAREARIREKKLEEREKSRVPAVFSQKPWQPESKMAKLWKFLGW